MLGHLKQNGLMLQVCGLDQQQVLKDLLELKVIQELRDHKVLKVQDLEHKELKVLLDHKGRKVLRGRQVRGNKVLRAHKEILVLRDLKVLKVQVLEHKVLKVMQDLLVHKVHKVLIQEHKVLKEILE
jgi:hypothetical protein